ncbi:Uncharacterised protein [Streptococcus pneumoniae]|nr:Uncharacterised protein [Streptococcus pneumoniae]
MVLRGHHERLDPVGAGALQTAGVGDVGAHRGDLHVQGAGGDGVEDGLQVGAGTGDEGNDAHAPIVG